MITTFKSASDCKVQILFVTHFIDLRLVKIDFSARVKFHLKELGYLAGDFRSKSMNCHYM